MGYCMAGNFSRRNILPLGDQKHFDGNLNSPLHCWLLLVLVCQQKVQNLISSIQKSSESGKNILPAKISTYTVYEQLTSMAKSIDLR